MRGLTRGRGQIERVIPAQGVQPGTLAFDGQPYLVDVLVRYLHVGHRTPVGLADPHGLQLSPRLRRRRNLAGDDHSGQRPGAGAVRQAVDIDVPTSGREGQPGVVQRRTATDRELARRGVERLQPPFRHRPQFERLVVHPPVPRLRVEHGRRLTG